MGINFACLPYYASWHFFSEDENMHKTTSQLQSCSVAEVSYSWQFEGYPKFYVL